MKLIYYLIFFSFLLANCADLKIKRNFNSDIKKLSHQIDKDEAILIQSKSKQWILFNKMLNEYDAFFWEKQILNEKQYEIFFYSYLALIYNEKNTENYHEKFCVKKCNIIIEDYMYSSNVINKELYIRLESIMHRTKLINGNKLDFLKNDSVYIKINTDSLIYKVFQPK